MRHPSVVAHSTSLLQIFARLCADVQRQPWEQMVCHVPCSRWSFFVANGIVATLQSGALMGDNPVLVEAQHRDPCLQAR